MTFAVLFPGQGSQSVGMCDDVRTADTGLFSEASEILGWDLDALIASGPDEELTRTEHAQPALYVTSYALWKAFSEQLNTEPAAFAGHSLGEYTAHAAAGSFSFAEGLRLVAERGRAMAEAAAAASSSMAALLGADEAAAEEIASARRGDGGQLHVANINAPGQIVVAGGDNDIAWLEENARDLGVRRAIRLKVAGAFHSPYMQPARDRLDAALGSLRFGRSSVPVYANATARVTEDIAVSLSEQLTSPVRFAASLEGMNRAGINTFIHVGPGDVTAGLVKRTLKDVNVLTVSTIDEASAVAEEVSV